MCELAKKAGEIIEDHTMNCNLRLHDAWTASGKGGYMWTRKGSRWVPKRTGPDTGIVAMEGQAVTPEELKWMTTIISMERAVEEGIIVTAALTCDGRRERVKNTGATWYGIERELWEHDLECKPDFAYGTMLRNPLELMRSYINYRYDSEKKLLLNLRSEIHNASHSPSASGKWGYGVNPETKMFDNFQVRSLSGAIDVAAGQINNTHLERAQQVLHEKFDIAIRLEDLHDHYENFLSALGWEDSASKIVIRDTNQHQLPGREASKEQKQRELNQAYGTNHTNHSFAPIISSAYLVEFTPEEKTWLLETNKYDVQLWESLVYQKIGHIVGS